MPTTPYSTYGTTMNGFDAQGVPVPIKMYFIKTAADAWDVYDGDPAGVPTPGKGLGSLAFDSAGKLVSPAVPLSATLTSANTNIGAFTATLDVRNVTPYGTAFAFADLTQDGYTAGTLTGISISDQGHRSDYRYDHVGSGFRRLAMAAIKSEGRSHRESTN